MRKSNQYNNKTLFLLMAFLLIGMSANAQTLKYPDYKDYCAPGEGAKVTPDGLTSYCNDDGPNVYIACECRYEKAIKAYKAQKKKVEDFIKELQKDENNYRKLEREQFSKASSIESGFDDSNNIEGDKRMAISHLESAIRYAESRLNTLDNINSQRLMISANSGESTTKTYVSQNIDSYYKQIQRIRDYQQPKKVSIVIPESPSVSSSSPNNSNTKTQGSSGNNSSSKSGSDTDTDSDDDTDSDSEAEAINNREQSDRARRNSFYSDRIAQQRTQNTAIAASAAASSAGLLYILGGVIYNGMGLPARDLFSGNNFNVGFDFGYGISAFPMANDSRIVSFNEFSGDTSTTTSQEPVTALTIDMRLKLRLSYEMEYAGVTAFGQFEPGFSPIFTGFNTSYAYGGEIFAGHRVFKLYGRYQAGSRSFSNNNWLDPEEEGEGGQTNTNYQQVRAGLKFSYYRNSRTALRDHLTFGIIEDYFDDDSADIFSIRNEPSESYLNLLETPGQDLEIDPYVATGYFFEWKRDHTHTLYIEVYPDYPITGETGGTSPDGSLFIQIGFQRSLDAFYRL